ncbi:MAG: hypothetical protein A2X52_01195 [Candidatus Rokubacteria bacterium GWC2_70_16]|nr:MAG: hypothetical protein A2X52_01195 [Candidatus Rokubacteria bacterium GWC2_70_16]
MSYEQVDWAFAHRVNAVGQLGTGLWNRVLIDATRSWKFARRSEWGNERFPPTVRPAAEDEARVRARWDEYGLGDL